MIEPYWDVVKDLMAVLCAALSAAVIFILKSFKEDLDNTKKELGMVKRELNDHKIESAHYFVTRAEHVKAYDAFRQEIKDTRVELLQATQRIENKLDHKQDKDRSND